MAEFEEVIGKTPSVGKLVEVVEDPEDPGEIVEVIPLEVPIPKPLHIFTTVCALGRKIESPPRSRPPRKSTRELIDLGNVDRVLTPSVGISRSDKLLGYLMRIIFGPGRFKLWWKDWIATCNMSLMFESSSCLLEESMLDSVRKIVGNEAPDLPRYARDKSLGRPNFLAFAVREEYPLRLTRCVLLHIEDNVSFKCGDELGNINEEYVKKTSEETKPGKVQRSKDNFLKFRSPACMFNSDYVVDYAFLR
ncbi:hypothetical protein L1987_50943 [Smallanthus sonchifolius]|uniref:Uncharacterized protein n=1 Tax=Smallanthus sonchifolius TaxID=185202 RepID=A0ACB9ENY5_9ASTR|nr:hypothetical protein L1987_50943 [Smallanthus sonchifolius]